MAMVGLRPTKLIAWLMQAPKKLKMRFGKRMRGKRKGNKRNRNVLYRLVRT